LDAAADKEGQPTATALLTAAVLAVTLFAASAAYEHLELQQLVEDLLKSFVFSGFELGEGLLAGL